MNRAKFTGIIKYILGLSLVFFVSCLVYSEASALGNFLSLSEITVYAGDTVDIKNYVNTEGTLSYAINSDVLQFLPQVLSRLREMEPLRWMSH